MTHITQARPRCIGSKVTFNGVTYDGRGYVRDLRTATRFHATVRPGWRKIAPRYYKPILAVQEFKQYHGLV